MRRTVSSAVLLVFLLVCSQMVLADQSKEEIAVTASKAWLSLVDGGRYVESWHQAAAYFKNALSKEQWERSLVAVRKPLGSVLSRRLVSKTYTKTLPGAPDGEYVVIQYESSFENKKSAIETITPMLQADGHWRVAGYYIK